MKGLEQNRKGKKELKQNQKWGKRLKQKQKKKEKEEDTTDEEEGRGNLNFAHFAAVVRSLPLMVVVTGSGIAEKRPLVVTGASEG